MAAIAVSQGPSHEPITLVGGHGFIGRHLAEYFAAQGAVTRVIGRGNAGWRDADLGRIFYCAGLTADFRSRPYDTIDAHVAFLGEMLRSAAFSSFVYLSSTRVYARAATTGEDTIIPIAPADPSDLYNVSKLAGEALCLSCGLENVRVARLSNVFGGDIASENFLTSILRDAIRHGHIELGTSLDSAKDYVSVWDVVRTLDAISIGATQKIYNVASGRNTSHRALIEKIAAITGSKVSVRAQAPLQSFPDIDVARMTTLVGSARDNVLDHIEPMLADMRSHLAESST